MRGIRPSSRGVFGGTVPSHDLQLIIREISEMVDSQLVA